MTGYAIPLTTLGDLAAGGGSGGNRPMSRRSWYSYHRQVWEQTGDIGELLAMIDSVEIGPVDFGGAP